MFQKYDGSRNIPWMGLAVFALGPMQEGGSIPWWVWAIIIIILLVILWWWLRRVPDTRTTTATKSDAVIVPAPLVEPETAAQPLVEEPVIPVAPDDLVIVEGIGPKIAEILHAAGIHTFAQLAESDPEQLREILQREGLTLADPTSWPKQARIAAAGDWNGLQSYQDQLKGGR